MKVVLLTSDSNHMGCSLAKAYRDAGGPSFSSIYILAEPDNLDFPLWSKPFIALKLLGVGGIVRWLRRKMGVRFMSAEDLAARYDLGWPMAMAFGGARTVYVDSVNKQDTRQEIAAEKPDLLISVGLPEIIKPEVLALARFGGINLHNGAIERFRGHFSTFWEYFNCEERGGVSLHLMASKVDAGAMVANATVSLAVHFSVALEEKKRVGGRMLAEAIRHLEEEGELPSVEASGVDGQYYGWPTVWQVLSF